MKALLVTIPHSGEKIPSETPWLLTLPERLLMWDVDRYVDRLYRPVLEKLQISNIVAEWHRYVIDLNRLAEDVDVDSVIGSTNPSGTFSRGLHWAITTSGEKLMPQPMTLELHQQLVQRYFEPFHKSVQKQMRIMKESGAKSVYHIDAHSMPSVGTKEHRDPGERRAEIVISDCKGRSCSEFFRELVISSYKSAGFKVAKNWPYFGGRITETYGHPEQGQESIQVELNRAVYMDEGSKALNLQSLNKIQTQLTQAIELIFKGLPNTGPSSY